MTMSEQELEARIAVLTGFSIPMWFGPYDCRLCWESVNDGEKCLEIDFTDPKNGVFRGAAIVHLYCAAMALPTNDTIKPHIWRR